MTAVDDSPSQKTTGWRSIFSLAPVYQFAQNAIGATAFRRFLVDEVIAAGPDDTILDMGCGTADILHDLPECTYVGFDPSERYIAAARQRFGESGRFEVASAADVDVADDSVSLALAVGVMHHLDDAAARSLLELAARALRPGGRLVTIDPTLVDGQHRVARFLVSRDRGQHVRSPKEIRALVPTGYSDVDVTVRHDLLRPPYSHVLIQATK